METAPTTQPLSAFVPQGLTADGVDIKDLVARQPNIAVSPGDNPTPVGVNLSGANMLKNTKEHGTLFSGMAKLVSGRAAPSALKGVALSTDAFSFAGQVLAAGVQGGTIKEENYAATFAPMLKEVEGTDAIEMDGWVVLGPQATALAAMHMNGKPIEDERIQKLSYVLRHELEHTISPRTDPAAIHKEEAIADFMTTMPGEVERSAQAMGLGTIGKRTFELSYPDHVAALRMQLGDKGINIAKPGAFAEVDQLLQGKSADVLDIATPIESKPIESKPT